MKITPISEQRRLALSKRPYTSTEKKELALLRTMQLCGKWQGGIHQRHVPGDFNLNCLWPCDFTNILNCENNRTTDADLKTHTPYHHPIFGWCFFYEAVKHDAYMQRLQQTNRDFQIVMLNNGCGDAPEGRGIYVADLAELDAVKRIVSGRVPDWAYKLKGNNLSTEFYSWRVQRPIWRKVLSLETWAAVMNQGNKV